MHHRKAYMYINFQQNRVSRSIKTVHTNLLAKHRKLHKVATCNSHFEKSRLTGMNCPHSRHSSRFGDQSHYHEKNVFPQTTDGWTYGRRDRQTDGQTSCTTTTDSFFEKRKNTKKCMIQIRVFFEKENNIKMRL